MGSAHSTAKAAPDIQLNNNNIKPAPAVILPAKWPEFTFMRKYVV